MFISIAINLKKNIFIYLPEIEFDSCDPGILTGAEEFCKRLDKSSKFAKNN